MDISSHQGNAVFNYCDASVPYTRITEHKHFQSSSSSARTLITYEYSQEWQPGTEMYYPVANSNSGNIYNLYENEFYEMQNTFKGGRLADFRYYDMHVIVEQVINRFSQFS